ncbi:IscS subfamily cysteine desulfurase [Cerasibacillus sp. JNUCC 74]
MKYFDYAATTPMDPEVLEVYQTVASTYWGNPSSLHQIGSQAKELLENSRMALAKLLHVPARGIYFTSGGTEANQLAITSLAFSQSHRGKHIITSMAEHSSVFSALGYLKGFGFEITHIPYLANGQLDFLALERAIRSDTILVTISHVNGEIGSIQPLAKISERLKQRQIMFHTDCVQSFGKIDLKPLFSLVDSFSISAHKIYGPKGVGAIFINPNYAVKGIFPFETHEHGLRGGTVNTPGIAAFAGAALKNTETDWSHVNALRKLFLDNLEKELKSKYRILESPQQQIPHIIGLAFHGYEGQLIMLECNRKGFCISTGSACGQALSISGRTMIAMGYSEDEQKEFVRISFGKDTKKEDVIQLVQVLKNSIQDRNNGW